MVPIAPATAVKASSEATRYGLRRGPRPSVAAPRLDSYRLPAAPVATVEPLTVPVPEVPVATPNSAPRAAPSALETHSFDFKL